MIIMYKGTILLSVIGTDMGTDRYVGFDCTIPVGHTYIANAVTVFNIEGTGISSLLSMHTAQSIESLSYT
jgi:hypothetical protein